MSPELANFLFEATNLLLLAAGLGWFFFKPMRHAIEAERTRHAEEQKSWMRQKEAAERLLREANAKRAAVDKELVQSRTQMLEAARAESQTLLEAAKAEAVAQRQRQTEHLEAERRRDVDASIGIVARIAGTSVQNLLLAASGPELNTSLVRVACERLSHLSSTTWGRVTVESALPLRAEESLLLHEALQEEFVSRVVPELGTGVRIITDVGQIDASALGIARSAADQALTGLTTPQPVLEAPRA